MKIHEYQGKEILKRYGVRIQEGIVAETPEQAVEAAKRLTEETGTGWHVIKAQIHAGGRGKGTVKETGINGVKVAKNIDQIKDLAVTGGLWTAVLVDVLNLAAHGDAIRIALHVR